MTLSFGFLTLNKKGEYHYFTEVAKMALPLSIEVFCFSPSDINPQTEQVHGKKYNVKDECWDEAIYPIPAYIYDRCFYSSDELLKKFSPVVNWLKNRQDITFIGHGLPNKWKIYNTLSTHPLLKYYIPVTIKVEKPEDVFKALNKYKKVLLKPESGSQGKGIISLKLKGSQIELQTHRHQKIIHKIFSNKEQLNVWLKKLLLNHSYLVQPFLSLQDREMSPFDIRIVMQKNKENNWHELGRGIRKGLKGHIISNLHGGGSTLTFPDWLTTLDRHQQTIIVDDINTIITHLPRALEQNFGPLFELGIDIGVAKDGTIWVLDTNSKPGHKTILQTNKGIENTIYEAPLVYSKHLELQRSEISNDSTI